MTNPALATMLGYSSSADLTNLELSENNFLPTYPREQFLENIKREGVVRGLESAWKRKDGSEFYVRESARAIHDSAGNIIYFDGTVEDITERKHAEEQIRLLNIDLEKRVAQRTAELEAINKELNAFAYSVSHDLRAPLRAIDGFSKILEEDYLDRLDEEGKRLLTIIQGNTLAMGKLIDDLLAFSRVSRKEINLTEVDMNALVQGLISSFEHECHDRKIQFSLSDLPRANADSAMMKVVWQNLLSNAVKYTSTREIGIIEIHGVIGDNEVIYSIQDNGVGFDMKYKNKLFQVFQRLHRSDEFSGTGIGLALVQRIILKHSGSVWGEGEVNQGALFCFSLPISGGKFDGE